MHRRFSIANGEQGQRQFEEQTTDDPHHYGTDDECQILKGNPSRAAGRPVRIGVFTSSPSKELPSRGSVREGKQEHRSWMLSPQVTACATALFGGLAVEVFMRGVGFSLGWMNDTVDVLGRAVDRIKLQRLIPGVFDVMPRTGRYDHGHIGPDPAHIAVDQDFAFAVLDTEELIAVVVNLFADLLAGLKRHQHELHICCRIKNTAKIRVSFGQFLDVINKSTHEMLHFISLLHKC